MNELLNLLYCSAIVNHRPCKPQHAESCQRQQIALFNITGNACAGAMTAFYPDTALTLNRQGINQEIYPEPPAGYNLRLSLKLNPICF